MMVESPKVARSEVIHAFAEAARQRFQGRLVAVYLLPQDPYEERTPPPEEQGRLLHFGLVLTEVVRGAESAYAAADLISEVEARFDHAYAITAAVAERDESGDENRPAFMEGGVLL
ncbi:MAG: hypothetical protein GVY18_01900 [Bacteroidetes bacterium]|jgi:hypothetical protein|nr:hypothetical protein [Bacteroidota bacterium]